MGCALQVVDQTTANLWNRGEGTVVVLVVEGWGPVVRHVLHDSAGGARGSLSAGVVHVETEAVATYDRVSVSPLLLEEASSLPMMVWTWPATLPGLTIGSARSVTSGAAHGRRQKASTSTKERVAIARTLEKRMMMMAEE